MSDMRPHPGPRHPVRRLISAAVRPAHIRAEFTSGHTLHDAVQKVLLANTLTSASMTLLGGGFSVLKYTTGDIETRPDSNKQANFTFIREWENCRMIYGAATAGLSVEGSPMLHCHGVFMDSNHKQFGGHLFPQDCLISHPVIAYLVGHPNNTIQQFYDEETTHTIFSPITKENAHVF